MTIKVIQGLIGQPNRLGANDRAGTGESRASVTNQPSANIRTLTSAASTEAAVTTIRSTSKAAAERPRSAEDAEAIARRVAKNLKEDDASDFEAAHSGLDYLHKSGTTKEFLLP